MVMGQLEYGRNSPKSPFLPQLNYIAVLLYPLHNSEVNILHFQHHSSGVFPFQATFLSSTKIASCQIMAIETVHEAQYEKWDSRIMLEKAYQPDAFLHDIFYMMLRLSILRKSPVPGIRICAHTYIRVWCISSHRDSKIYKLPLPSIDLLEIWRRRKGTWVERQFSENYSFHITQATRAGSWKRMDSVAQNESRWHCMVRALRYWR